MESLISKTCHAAVIGGVNMDIGGKTLGRPVLGDSNPGLIRATPGGVGRNIAHDLRYLGVEVSLVAALGDDMYADAIERSCDELGISLAMSRRFAGQRSSCYLYVADETGEMHIGISDMDIVNNISPEYLSAHMESINRFDAAVLDANLPQESISYLARNCAVPLYADPVSTVKAMKLMDALPRLRCLKPNAIEARAMTGEGNMERAAAVYIKAGVERVFISLGPEGMLAADRRETIVLPCRKGPIINTTGAGDSATAAIVWADMQGLSLADTARAALIAGSLTCAHPGANTPELRELGRILQEA